MSDNNRDRLGDDDLGGLGAAGTLEDVLEHIAEEHVFYEARGVVLFHLNGTAVPLELSLVPPELRQLAVGWVTGSVLEAGLVHARCLVEFLTGSIPAPSSTRTTDVVAAHYIPGKEQGHRYAEFVLGTSRAHQQELLAEIHQRVMHLTTRRLSVRTDAAFEWRDYVREQLPIVLGAYRAFLDDLLQQVPTRFAWFRRSHELLVAAGFQSKVVG